MGFRLPRSVALGAAAAALALVVAGGAALAQTPAPSSTPPAASSAQQHADELLGALASKLGKTPEELRAAVVAVQKEQVAQAVQQGRLTQEQADRLNQRIDQQAGRLGLGLLGNGFGGHRGGPKAGARAPSNRIPVDMTALAGFLGVQPQELAEAQRAGKSLVQLAQEKGKSRDALEAHLATQARGWVSQQVQQGRLTQPQADQRLADLDARIDRFVERAAPAGRPAPRGTSA
jgi:hypothetical protein